MFDIAIIGAGVIGAAVAMELSKYHISVAVIEKESDVSCGSTKANTGIIHSGFMPSHGTLMSKYCLSGAEVTESICKRLSVPYKRVPSLVLAFNDIELSTIANYYRQGIENGVADLHLLTPKQVKTIEPNISQNIKGALLSKTTGIINPFEYTIAMCENAVENGAKIFLETKVTNIELDRRIFIIQTNNKNNPTIKSRFLINASGVNANDIYKMVHNDDLDLSFIKGEFLISENSEANSVNNIIFTCPETRGTRFTIAPTTYGNVISSLYLPHWHQKDDISITTDNLNYIQTGTENINLKTNFKNTIKSFAGTCCASPSGDFIVSPSTTISRFYNIAAINMTGITSAPIIAKDVARYVKHIGFDMRLKSKLITKRKHTRFFYKSIDEKKKLISENPLYGKIICRCNNITEAEIINELNRPFVPNTINGIKRRCSAMMGKCQGNDCSPKIFEIMRNELQIRPKQISQDQPGSYIVKGGK